jgi:hypothetical protein
MPKLDTLKDNADFLASVQASIYKASFKARQNRNAFNAMQDVKGYWKEQQRRKNDPSAKSFDALTDYVLI